VQQVLFEAVEALAGAGVTIVETDVENVEFLNEAVSAALRLESSFALPKALASLDPAVTLEMVKNQTRSQAISEALSAIATRAAVPEQIAEALRLHRPRLRDAFTTALATAGADALLVPTTPLPAVPLHSTASLTINGREVDFFSYTRATLPAANAGLPFLSIPVAYLGFLPIGLGLIGRHREDASLLAIGAALEAVLAGRRQSAGRYGS
jgi:mandelamide amidase